MTEQQSTQDESILAGLDSSYKKIFDDFKKELLDEPDLSQDQREWLSKIIKVIIIS